MQTNEQTNVTMRWFLAKMREDEPSLDKARHAEQWGKRKLKHLEKTPAWKRKDGELEMAKAYLVAARIILNEKVGEGPL